VLTGEVLSKIVISRRHTIYVVCHAVRNLLETMFLANIPLTKQSMAYWTDEDIPTYFADPLLHPLVLSMHDEEMWDVENPRS